MSYSIDLFPNLIFHFLEIIWTYKIFNNFSSCGIEFPNGRIIFFFQIVKFDEIVNYRKSVNYCIINLLFGKLANFQN